MYFRVENDFYISNTVVKFKIILFMIFLLLISKSFLSFSTLFSNIPSAKLVMQANFKFILIILSHHLMRFNFQSTRSNFGHLFSNFNAIFLILLLVLICPVGQSKYQVVVVNRANPSAIYREAWQYTLYYYVVLLQGEVEKCSVQSGGGDPVVVVFSGVWDCFRWFQYNLVPLGNQNCHTSLQYILVYYLQLVYSIYKRLDRQKFDY